MHEMANNRRNDKTNYKIDKNATICVKRKKTCRIASKDSFIDKTTISLQWHFRCNRQHLTVL